MTIAIRQATHADLSELSDVCSRSFFDTYHGKGKDRPAEMAAEYLRANFSVEKLASELASAQVETWVATAYDKIVGYFKISASAPPNIVNERKLMQLERLYLLKEFIGQEIGKGLLNRAQARAAELGYDGLWLGVWDDNIAATEFYRRQGFRTVGKVEWKFSYRDVHYVDNDIVMTKLRN